MKTQALFTLLVAVLLMAGCASSKQAAEPHPLAGMWDYTVDTPEGVYNGVITVSETEGELSGTITSDALTGQMALTDLMFENDVLSFKFDSGQFGVIDLRVTVDGMAFDGYLDIQGIGQMPVTGSKKSGGDM